MKINTPATGRLAWYDRTPSTQVSAYLVSGVAPHSATSRWSYTVPTGKKFRVEWMQVQMIRITAATTVDLVTSDIQLTPSGGSLAHMKYDWHYSNTVLANAVFNNTPQLTLQSGDVIADLTNDLSTGGTMEYLLTMKGTEFDA